MPRVPTVDAPQVGAAPIPFVPVSTDGAQQGAALAGREAQAMGGVMDRAGSMASSIGIDMREMANQVQINSAMNSARQAQLDLTFNPDTGYKNLKGNAALVRPNGEALPDEYGGKFQTAIADIANGLGNDAQKREFGMQANNLLTSFKGDVQGHMLTEFRSHALSEQDGTIKIGTDTAKLNWDHPENIGPAIDSMKAAVARAGQITGEAATETVAKMKTVVSNVHASVIGEALQNNNPEYALSYINANKDAMTADDLLKSRAAVNRDYYARVADGVATTVVGTARQAVQPTDTSRVKIITAQSESNGNRDAVGRFIPGQGTAKGDMQVMDATNKTPGYGVTPAKDDSAAERSRVGGDYIEALAKNYGGDMAKAWAAYNWGPAKVDAAVKASGANWLASAPAETQAYVNKNLAALNAGGGTPPQPTLQDIHDGIRSRITAQFGATPPMGMLTAALQSGTKQWEDMHKDIAAKGNNAVLQAQQWLIANGGDFAKLPSNLVQAVTQYSPGKMDDLALFSKHIAKGENLTNMDAYNMAVTYPDELAKMPDAMFMQFLKTNFSTADQEKVVKLRANELNGKEDLSAGAINRPAVSRALNAQLDALRIPTTHDLKNPTNNERLGGIRLFVDNSILDAQRASGQKMTTDQVNAHIAKLFATDVTFKNTLWYGGQGADTSQKLMSMQIADLPNGATEGLRKSLIASGNRAPTDTDILNLYRRLHAR